MSSIFLWAVLSLSNTVEYNYAQFETDPWLMSSRTQLRISDEIVGTIIIDTDGFYSATLLCDNEYKTRVYEAEYRYGDWSLERYDSWKR